MNEHPRVADVLALAFQLRDDADRPRKELLARDRRLAKAMPTSPRSPATVLKWLRQVDERNLRKNSSSFVVGCWVCAVLLGGLAGTATSLAVFRYDGQRPLNVLVILGLFVVLQLGLVVISSLALVNAIPGSATLRWSSPGRWMLAATSRLPDSPGKTARDLGIAATSSGRMLGPMSRPFVVLWSQLAAISFNAMAVVVFLFLVTTRDLAFGWASTLSLQPDRMHALTSSLAWFWPSVAPDLETVSATQVFQANEFRGAVVPKVFTTWWRFIAVMLVAYGLIPRLLLAAVSGLMLRRATRQAFDTWPGSDEVLRRLLHPAVETSGRPGSIGSTPDATAERDPAARSDQSISSQSVIVCWAQAPGPGGAHPAGPSRTLQEDRDLIAMLGNQPDPVTIRVRAWEPPIHEFFDFVKELRKSLGDRRVINVLPVGPPDKSVGHRASWRRQIQLEGDPWLRVRTEPDEGEDQ